MESLSATPKSDPRRRDGREKKAPAKETGAYSEVSAEWEPVDEKDAVADVAGNMKKASIEDKEDAEVGA